MVISYGFTSKNGDRNKHILGGYWYLFTSNGLISMGCHPGDRPQLVDLRVASSEVENLHQEWRFVWKIIELNLVGGWAYPSEKWWSSSVGMMKFPIYGKTSSKPPTSNGSMGDLQLQRLPRFFFPLLGHCLGISTSEIQHAWQSLHPTMPAYLGGQITSHALPRPSISFKPL